MLKITRLADYSVLILCCFKDKKLTAKSISNKTGLGIATVNKILSLLVKAKILKPVRGANGGYCPLKSLKEVSIKDIIEAIEGPVALTKCVESSEEKIVTYIAHALLKMFGVRLTILFKLLYIKLKLMILPIKVDPS